MSNILENLKSLKDKLSLLEETFSDKIIEEERQKRREERLIKKLDQLKDIQSNKVYVNAGGQKTIVTSRSTIENFYYSCYLKTEYQNNINSTSPLFVDTSAGFFEVFIEIMRRNLNKTNCSFRQKLVVGVDIDQFTVESSKFFGSDSEEVLSHFELCYISNELREAAIEEEKRKKAALNRKWPQSTNILCYKCGKSNDGTFWKQKLSYDRNDTYCVDGHYATCATCDPDGSIKY